MGKQKINKVKKVKKEKKNKFKFDSKFWIGIFILITMVFSLAGFALISAGPNSKSSGIKAGHNIPLQYFPKYGVWATVINNQQFVFKDINQFQNLIDIQGIADNMKKKDYLNLYFSDDFDPSSRFILLNALKALKINYDIKPEAKCDDDSMLLFSTINESKNISGNCIIFIGNGNQTYNRSNALVYYLVK